MNLHHYHHIVFDGPLNLTVRSDVSTEALFKLEIMLNQVLAILADLQGADGNKPARPASGSLRPEE